MVLVSAVHRLAFLFVCIEVTLPPSFSVYLVVLSPGRRNGQFRFRGAVLVLRIAILLGLPWLVV